MGLFLSFLLDLFVSASEATALQDPSRNSLGHQLLHSNPASQAARKLRRCPASRRMHDASVSGSHPRSMQDVEDVVRATMMPIYHPSLCQMLGMQSFTSSGRQSLFSILSSSLFSPCFAVLVCVTAFQVCTFFGTSFLYHCGFPFSCPALTFLRS